MAGMHMVAPVALFGPTYPPTLFPWIFHARQFLQRHSKETLAWAHHQRKFLLHNIITMSRCGKKCYIFSTSNCKGRLARAYKQPKLFSCWQNKKNHNFLFISDDAWLNLRYFWPTLLDLWKILNSTKFIAVFVNLSTPLQKP